jgi:hypothetical protein
MLLQWTIVYRELVSQHRKRRTDPFADPLDSCEWEGFGWIVKWFEKSAERRSKATEGLPGAQPVARNAPPQHHGLMCTVWLRPATFALPQAGASPNK